eukprot:CAMPEP_0204598140 /NCGR_PEP_ID=MMETSP0661-20131031/54164_1 /ASSEMBLY_ACC=CAM_ASM_000606 /TAXON_ID=109239 /ORGANISM="Alexandrium margalefi, Strain AMGDE01CS-322" /LENGTH=61 /DNA_ID=CAMNT_0051608841 /DNA_START=125 /DNA_END=310 /DNA_ORIENTATION=-
MALAPAMPPTHAIKIVCASVLVSGPPLESSGIAKSLNMTAKSVGHFSSIFFASLGTSTCVT